MACNLGSKPRHSAAALETRFIACVSRSEGFSRKISICWGLHEGKAGFGGDFLT